VRLLERPRLGGVFNVASGVSMGIGDALAHLISRATVPVDVVSDPALFRPMDAPDLRGDAGRLRAAVGWAPVRTPTDTLDEILDDARRRAPGSSLTPDARPLVEGSVVGPDAAIRRRPRRRAGASRSVQFRRHRLRRRLDAGSIAAVSVAGVVVMIPMLLFDAISGAAVAELSAASGRGDDAGFGRTSRALFRLAGAGVRRLRRGRSRRAGRGRRLLRTWHLPVYGRSRVPRHHDVRGREHVLLMSASAVYRGVGRGTWPVVLLVGANLLNVLLELDVDLRQRRSPETRGGGRRLRDGRLARPCGGPRLRSFGARDSRSRGRVSRAILERTEVMALARRRDARRSPTFGPRGGFALGCDPGRVPGVGASIPSR
jgi:hypothetical protein